MLYLLAMSVIALLMAHHLIKRARQSLKSMPTVPSTALLLIILLVIPTCEAAGGDESSGPKCPIFEGVNAAFMTWLIAFSAWVAWKKPELAPFIRGKSTKPVPVDPAAPTPRERTAAKKWDELNIQLYGAVVSHVSAHIQASLHVATPDDGVRAIDHLKQRYGAQSTGDRAEAMARIQRSYIDPRAKISEADVTKQFNEMSMAVADVLAAGGAALDDTLLISMFENSLPIAYGAIRQMIRYQKHTSFDAYFNDMLTQVKAEERSAQSTVATAFISQSYNPGKGRGGKGKGKGRYNNPGGKGRGKGYSNNWNQSYNPCFNCGRTDHPRYNCPEQQTTCEHCGANHVSEMCSLGPGGPLRDALSINARTAIDRAAARGRTSQPALLTMSSGETYEESQSQSGHTRVYNANRKRPISTITNEVTPHDSISNVGSVTAEHTGSASSAPQRQSGQGGARVYQANQRSVPTSREIDEFLRSSGFGAFMMHAANDGSTSTVEVLSQNSVHLLAYIDSQASYFAVPDVSYLSKVTDWSPNLPIETANGIVTPDAIGELTISLCDDDGLWHTFTIAQAWVLKSCKKLLYSQAAMNQLGVLHRLDEGYLLLPNGAKKSISRELYSVDLLLGYPDSDSACVPQSDRNSNANPSLRVARSSIPQKLLWQRLGCPGRRIWLGVGDVLTDHGLPPNPHLKYDFETTDAVAQARSRLLPFNQIRDPDPLHVPGSTIYMDFAGPMVASYPHQFIYYCGAIDAGSGYSKLVPCHAATKEVAKACLESLVADIRMLMGLTHRFIPHVVVSDQGTQFMSAYFRDFLTEDQIAHRPAVVYTPQQNSFIERMWGTRFAAARTLLKAANLGPSFHPFAVQTSNWICNRMPQPWRANLSPFYILSRRLASAAYLKVFGSLCRMTIPWARREGDKHFADRGVLGIYLGPSESSPGCVVYVPSTRRFYTSRNVICYEDTQPGVRHVDSKWREIEDPNHPLQGTAVGESSDQPTSSTLGDSSPYLPTQIPSVPQSGIISESPTIDVMPRDDPSSRSSDGPDSPEDRGGDNTDNTNDLTTLPPSTEPTVSDSELMRNVRPS